LANLSKSISNPVESPAGVQTVASKLPEMVMNRMFITAVVIFIKKKKGVRLAEIGLSMKPKIPCVPLHKFF
jgi:hypothetical protein